MQLKVSSRKRNGSSRYLTTRWGTHQRGDEVGVLSLLARHHDVGWGREKHARNIPVPPARSLPAGRTRKEEEAACTGMKAAVVQGGGLGAAAAALADRGTATVTNRKITATQGRRVGSQTRGEGNGGCWVRLVGPVVWGREGVGGC